MLWFISIWLIASVIAAPVIGALCGFGERRIERTFVSSSSGTKYGTVNPKFYGW